MKIQIKNLIEWFKKINYIIYKETNVFYIVFKRDMRKNSSIFVFNYHITSYSLSLITFLL